MGKRLSEPMAPDLTGVRAQLKHLLEEGSHDSLVELVLHLLDNMAQENTRLAFRLQAALRQLYRKKSERISPEQLALFLSVLEQEAASPPEATDSGSGGASSAAGEEGGSPAAPAKPSKRPKKRPFPDNLRREVRVIPVPEAERTCTECCGPKEGMGYEKREVWEFKPAEFYIIEERLEKVVCKKCQEGVVTAEGTSKPIERGRPGPGLLAQIVTSKHRDEQPLYRQSDIYKRSGIVLSPSTLGDWAAATADILSPLWKVAREETLSRYLVSLDDTGMPVLDKDTPNGIKRGRLWTYLGDYENVGFCEYTPNWKGDGPCAVLMHFKGKYIQSDGYAGINALFENPNAPRRAGCMDHCRRKFVAALEAGHQGAAFVLKLMQDVYAVERKAREDGLGPEGLLERREKSSKPLMDKLQVAIAELQRTALPKSALGKAVTYAINQWDTLCVFLTDARVPLSNAHVERQQRRIALGRKNYLFAGSDEGGKRLAILQTFVILCELADVDLFEYLRDILGKIHDWPNKRLHELLPAAWAAEKKRQQLDGQRLSLMPSAHGPEPGPGLSAAPIAAPTTQL